MKLSVNKKFLEILSGVDPKNIINVLKDTIHDSEPDLLIWKKLTLAILTNDLTLLEQGAIDLKRFENKNKADEKNYIFTGMNAMRNNIYWCESISLLGINVKKFAYSKIKMNKESDFDVYFPQIASAFKHFHPLVANAATRVSLMWLISRYCHTLLTAYDGFIFYKFKNSNIENVEPEILKILDIKIIVIPYGGDAYVQGDLINNPSLYYGMLFSYPEVSERGGLIRTRLDSWNHFADIVIPGFMLGHGPNDRNDVFAASPLCIDTEYWVPDLSHQNKVIKFLHYPNHRGFKGTQEIIEAFNLIESLDHYKNKFTFTLLEGVPNEQIHATITQYDVLVEQIYFCGYALSAIEGLSSGLAVMCNLHTEVDKISFYKKFGYLSECPCISTSPDTLVDTIKSVIDNQKKLPNIKEKSTKYARKFHSIDSAKNMFLHIFQYLESGSLADRQKLNNLYYKSSQNVKYGSK